MAPPPFLSQADQAINRRQAREEGDLPCALLAIAQLARIYESIAKLPGEALHNWVREVEPDIQLPDIDPSLIAWIRSSTTSRAF